MTKNRILTLVEMEILWKNPEIYSNSQKMSLKSVEVFNQLRKCIAITLHPNQSKFPKKFKKIEWQSILLSNRYAQESEKKSKTNTSARTYNDSQSGTELQLRKFMENHKRFLVEKS